MDLCLLSSSAVFFRWSRLMMMTANIKIFMLINYSVWGFYFNAGVEPLHQITCLDGFLNVHFILIGVFILIPVRLIWMGKNYGYGDLNWIISLFVVHKFEKLAIINFQRSKTFYQNLIKYDATKNIEKLFHMCIYHIPQFFYSKKLWFNLLFNYLLAKSC